MSRVVATEQCPQCARLGNDTRRDNLAVYSDGGAHCFSCGYHVFPKHYNKIKEVDNGPKALLPFDFTQDVPSSALPWLLQYGLPYSYWEPMLGYSPTSERLVFKVGHPNTAFSIGRYVGTNHPGSKKWFVWGDCHRHVETIGDGQYVILVEDLISAHKVGMAGFEGVPLFGTHVHNPVIYHLLTANKPVILWLDKDQAFNVKRQALRLASIVPQDIHIINTDKDPKCLSFDEIRSHINDL